MLSEPWGLQDTRAIACFEILQGAIKRILSPENKAIEISLPQICLLLLVLGVNIFVAVYEGRVGRRLGSSILIADAKHTTSDIWVTVLVIVGLIGVWLGATLDLPQLQWLDIVLSFPVALLVFRSGYEVIRENLPWLVDEMAVAPEAIRDVAMQVPGVLNCHDIASRGVVGRQAFIEMHIVVDAPDVATAHKITEEIEARLEARFSPVRISIHIEPPGYQSDRITYD